MIEPTNEDPFSQASACFDLLDFVRDHWRNLGYSTQDEAMDLAREYMKMIESEDKQ